MKKTSDFEIFVGIDWADNKHDVCISDKSGKVESLIIDNTPEAIDRLITSLVNKSSGKIAICLEQSRGSLIYALLKYDDLSLFPVNPKSLARYREAFSPSGAKDDPIDAKCLCELVMLHRDKLREWNPGSKTIRKLSLLVENRRKLVTTQTKLTNRLTATLKSYFPQALDWIGGKASIMAIDFVEKWPTLGEVQKARKSTIERFYKEHNSRRAEVIERRINEIKSATPLVTDEAIIEASAMVAKSIVAMLRPLLASISSFDKEILELCKTSSDYDMFKNLPGAGDVLAPRLLSAFGEDRQKFEKSDDISKFSGVVPIVSRSGNSKIVRFRLACPKFIRQTFVEFAEQSRFYSYWAEAFYQYKIQNGMKHNAAIRALAVKWIRIIFYCWKNNVQYDESVYLKALRKRNSPLLAYAAGVK